MKKKGGPKVNRYIYHYHAQYEVGGSVGKMTHIDGVAKLVERVSCHDDYVRLKKLIEPEHSHLLVMTALSYLGKEEEVT